MCLVLFGLAMVFIYKGNTQKQEVFEKSCLLGPIVWIQEKSPWCSKMSGP